MFYREAGQFRTTYAQDSQIFPLRQDRLGLALMLLIAAVVVPLTASDYTLRAILVPWLIFSLVALGQNILTGYAGQLSLGSAGAQTRRMIFSPNSPSGRTSRKRMAST